MREAEQPQTPAESGREKGAGWGEESRGGEGRGQRAVKGEGPLAESRSRGRRSRDSARVGEGGRERAGRSEAAPVAKSLKSFSRGGTQCQI